MMDQYKKETSQIHAPADLIQRTKLAVEEEEKRIQSTVENKADRYPRSPYRQVYRWALPVAAAMFLLVASMAVPMVQKRFSSSGFDTDAGGAALPTEGEAGGADTDMQFADGSMSEGGMESVQEHDEVDTDQTGQVAAPNMEAEKLSEDMADAMSEEIDADENKDFESERNSLTVTEVEEAPVFYADPDTERIPVEGEIFYVTKDWYGSMAAYVETEEGHYVFVGGNKDKMIEQNEFAIKAYELLSEINK